MIDFYFDFISPYGYFAAMKIDGLAKKFDRKVEWHPMLLGVSVMNVMGLKPLMETPLKKDYLIQDIPRLAALYNIPFSYPKHGMPKPLPPARAFCWVKEMLPERAGEFAKAVYRAQWQDGLDISQPQVLAKLVEEVGLNGEALKEALETETLRRSLSEKVDASINRGVFGSPTYMVDGNMIWGGDRMWMLEHWLSKGKWDSNHQKY
ncbi:MAG: 2-hydroxychromene-2-carboxylate isomerase [Bermanella sp.]